MRIIRFFDGYTSNSIPIQVGISELVVFDTDANFEAAYSGSPKSGDIYFNSTDNKIKYYNGSNWLINSDEFDISVLQAQITNNDTDIVNLGDRITSNDTDIATNLNSINNINSSVGAANGIAPLDANQKVPAINLPSYVDDVEEYADLSSFPATGETGKIYVALDNLKTYRWGGTSYAEVSPSEVNSVNGETGIVTLDNTDIGLGNVTNDSQLKRDAGDLNSFTEKAIPVVDDIVIIEDSEDGFSKKKSKLLNLLGSGSGSGKNYLGNNGDADKGIGDWVDTANSTILTNSSNPLNGISDFILTHNAGSDGVIASLDFDIDRTDLAEIMYVSLDYDTIGITETSQKIQVTMVDTVNGDELSVRGGNILLNNRQDSLIFSFQTVSDVTNYRLVIERLPNPTPPPLGYPAITFYIDDLSVGPREVTRSTGTSEWTVIFDSTLAFIHNDQSIGTLVTKPATGEYRVYYNKSFFPSNPIVNGVLLRPDGGGAVGYFLNGEGNDANGDYVQFRTVNTSGGGQDFTGTDKLQITFKQKLEDQTAFIQSVNLGTRTVAAEYTQVLVVGSTALPYTIPFQNRQTDTLGCYNTTTGVYTVKESGYYDINAYTAYAVTNTCMLSIHIDGILTHFGSYTATAANPSRVTANGVYLDVGQTVEFVYNQIAGGATISASATPGEDRRHYMSILKRSNPETLLESPKVNGHYQQNSGQTFTDDSVGFNTMVYNSKISDTHGSYNPSNGEFTCKVPGEYNFTFSIKGATSFGASTATGTRLVVNGVVLEEYIYFTEGSSNQSRDTFLNIKLEFGDVVTLRHAGISGGYTAGTDLTRNNFKFQLIK